MIYEMESLLINELLLSNRVLPIRGCPIDAIGHFYILRVIRTLQIIKHSDLFRICWTTDTGRYEVILIEDEISTDGTITSSSYLTGIHRTFGATENISA